VFFIDFFKNKIFCIPFSERRLAPVIEESWLLNALKPDNLVEHNRDICAFQDVVPEGKDASLHYMFFQKQPSGGASYTVRSGKSWFDLQTSRLGYLDSSRTCLAS
jgi:hypothetical protein